MARRRTAAGARRTAAARETRRSMAGDSSRHKDKETRGSGEGKDPPPPLLFPFFLLYLYPSHQRTRASWPPGTLPSLPLPPALKNAPLQRPNAAQRPPSVLRTFWAPKFYFPAPNPLPASPSPRYLSADRLTRPHAVATHGVYGQRRARYKALGACGGCHKRERGKGKAARPPEARVTSTFLSLRLLLSAAPSPSPLRRRRCLSLSLSLSRNRRARPPAMTRPAPPTTMRRCARRRSTTTRRPSPKSSPASLTAGKTTL